MGRRADGFVRPVMVGDFGISARNVDDIKKKSTIPLTGVRESE
jgi:hypothetical protein